jgi:hypothetical protein
MTFHYTEDNNIVFIPTFKIYNNAKESRILKETEEKGLWEDTDCNKNPHTSGNAKE